MLFIISPRSLTPVLFLSSLPPKLSFTKFSFFLFVAIKNSVHEHFSKLKNRVLDTPNERFSRSDESLCSSCPLSINFKSSAIKRLEN